MSYKHEFKDGDIVHDTVCREVFTFNEAVDGYFAEKFPDQMHLAEEKQIAYLNKKPRTFVYY